MIYFSPPQFKCFAPHIALLALFVALSYISTGCKRQPHKTQNIRGSITILRPYTEDERRVRDKFTLQVKLYDFEGLRDFSVIAEDQVGWHKTFPDSARDETMLETTIELSRFPLTDGRQILTMRLRDRQGQVTTEPLPLFIDRKGPSIEWLSPAPGSKIRHLVRAELRVRDLSGVQRVEVYYNTKLVQRLSFPPYVFSLDPAEFPSGILSLRAEADDGLGNRTNRHFSFEIVGSELNQPCSSHESCRSPLLCVKLVGEVRGQCRIPCRQNSDCPTHLSCQSVGKKQSACVPMIKRTVQLQPTYSSGAKIMEACSPIQICRKGLLCISLSPKDTRCLPTCGPTLPPCPPKFKCQKLPNSQKQVCVPTVKPPSLRKIGETCNPKQPCVEQAACVQAPKTTRSLCYRKCNNSDAECTHPLTCHQLPGRDYGICIKLQYREVGLFEICDKDQRLCRGKMICISTGGSSASRCFSLCPCDSNSICFGSGDTAFCMPQCNPQDPNCPDGMKCTFSLYKSKGYHLCKIF